MLISTADESDEETEAAIPEEAAEGNHDALLRPVLVRTRDNKQGL